MSFNSLKIAVHKKINQGYVYAHNEHISVCALEHGNILVSNDTSIVTMIALKSAKPNLNISVLEEFLDSKLESIKDKINKNGIKYISDITFWDDEDSILLINIDNVSEVQQSDKRYIVFVCGAQMPSFTNRKNLTKQIYFDIDKVSTLKNVREDMECLSIRAWEGYLSHLKSLPEIWFRQMLNAGKKQVITDTLGTSLDGTKFALASILMSQKLDQSTIGENNVGICLPTSTGGYLALLSLLIRGKGIVNLNYTASEESLSHAIFSAGIQTIITSKAFVEKLASKGFFVTNIFSECKIIYLEDVKKSITKFEAIKTLLKVKLYSANALVKKYVKPVSLDDLAFIIFSSGSEGVPKGIVIKHKNLLANVYQSTLVIECKENDSVAGILPIFHGFGLTISLVSLLQGAFIACHPDPTDAKGVAKLIKKYKSTVLCATPTFLRIYTKNKAVVKDDLSSLRLIVTGAEKLSKEVRDMFESKFDKVINEGYGTTELSPVAAVNRSSGNRNKIGTVGYTVPGGQFRIVHPDSFEEMPLGDEGMIIYRGVNKMDYYLNDDAKTNDVIIEKYGHKWYVTGDKGKIDNYGYLTVVDRYSRFAKVAGEIISLGLLEHKVYEALKLDGYDFNELDFEILAVATSSIKRGEIINLLFTLDIDIENMKEIVKHADIENLYRPSNYFKILAVPKLGSGKTDFSRAKKLANELVGNI